MNNLAKEIDKMPCFDTLKLSHNVNESSCENDPWLNQCVPICFKTIKSSVTQNNNLKEETDENVRMRKHEQVKNNLHHISSHQALDKFSLQNKGKVRIMSYYSSGFLTVHIIEAKELWSEKSQFCNSHIKVSLVSISKQYKEQQQQSTPVLASGNPFFDTKLIFRMTEDVQTQQLVISAWNEINLASRSSEFIGCVAFDAEQCCVEKKQIAGWYFLVNRSTCCVNNQPTASLIHTKSSPSRMAHRKRFSDAKEAYIAKRNQAVRWVDWREVRVTRDKKRFGFTVAGCCPVHISNVEASSSVEAAGMRVGDRIVKVNHVNVSRSSCKSVARLVRNCSKHVIFVLARAAVTAADNKADRMLHHAWATSGAGAASSSSKSSMNHLVTSFRQETSLFSLRDTPQAAVQNLIKHTTSQQELWHQSSRSMFLKSPSMPTGLIDVFHPVPRATRSYDDLNESSDQTAFVFSEINKHRVMASSIHLTFGEKLRFYFQRTNHRTTRTTFTRDFFTLIHWDALTLIESDRHILCDVYLFADVLLLTMNNCTGEIAVIREPIYTNDITRYMVSKTRQYDLVIQHLALSGNLQMLRLRGESEKQMSHWHRKLKNHVDCPKIL